jgi:hypothetical protein
VEQQGAAGRGDIGLSGWCGPDQRAVGKLLIAPTPEGFDQMM